MCLLFLFFYILKYGINWGSGIDGVGRKFPVKIFQYLQLVAILTPCKDVIYLDYRHDVCYSTDRLVIWYLDGRSGIGYSDCRSGVCNLIILSVTFFTFLQSPLL